MIEWLEKKRSFAIIFTLLIAIEIFFFSSIPGTNISPGGFDLSEAYHFIVFFLLNFFLLISMNGEKNLRVRYLFIALAISILYSISDEIHQLFVPLRSYDIKDILTDSTGIFISAFIYLYYKNKPRKRL